MEEVITLDQLVGKFGKRQAVFQALLHRILSQHIVHGNMLTYISDKIKEGEFADPVIIIDDLCFIGQVLVEVNKFL
ncbi:hypothetical protein D9M68_631610 [compost metagenome]